MDSKVLGYKDLTAIPKDKPSWTWNGLPSSWSTSPTVPIPSWNAEDCSEAKISLSPISTCLHHPQRCGQGARPLEPSRRLQHWDLLTPDEPGPFPSSSYSDSSMYKQPTSRKNSQKADLRVSLSLRTSSLSHSSSLQPCHQLQCPPRLKLIIGHASVIGHCGEWKKQKVSQKEAEENDSFREEMKALRDDQKQELSKVT